MTTTPNKDNLVARLLQQAAAVGVARKALNENTARAQAALFDTDQKLGLTIATLTSAPREIEAEEARIATLEEQRAIVQTRQTELEQQIADAPDWRLAGDRRQRDAEFERQQTLKLQLQKLREGTLLVTPHRAYARVGDLDARLKESNERIESLRAQLAEHLKQAEALLAAETVFEIAGCSQRRGCAANKLPAGPA